MQKSRLKLGAASLARVLKIAFDAVWSDGLTFDQARKKFAKGKSASRKAARV